MTVTSSCRPTARRHSGSCRAQSCSLSCSLRWTCRPARSRSRAVRAGSLLADLDLTLDMLALLNDALRPANWPAPWARSCWPGLPAQARARGRRGPGATPTRTPAPTATATATTRSSAAGARARTRREAPEAALCLQPLARVVRPILRNFANRDSFFHLDCALRGHASARGCDAAESRHRAKLELIARGQAH